jgi:signal peptidase II
MKKKVLFISLFLLLIDQVSKYFVLHNIALGSEVSVIKNFFSLHLVYNTGASWSILSNATVFLIIISFVALGIILYYLFRVKDSILHVTIFSLLLGGLVGNLIDRIMYGYVIDFLSFNFFGYSFPVFNAADIMIVIGGCLAIYWLLKGDKHDN